MALTQAVLSIAVNKNLSFWNALLNRFRFLVPLISPVVTRYKLLPYSSRNQRPMVDLTGPEPRS